MSYDPTEDARKDMVEEINCIVGDREILEKTHGKVWDTKELQLDFNVQGFLAPFVSVTRKADGKKGTLTFQHNPRFYFDFQEA